MPADKAWCVAPVPHLVAVADDDALVEVLGQHGTQDLHHAGEAGSGLATCASEDVLPSSRLTLMMVAAPNGGFTTSTLRRMSG